MKSSEHEVDAAEVALHRLRQGDSQTNMSSFAGGIAEQNDGSLLPWVHAIPTLNSLVPDGQPIQLINHPGNFGTEKCLRDTAIC